MDNDILINKYILHLSNFHPSLKSLLVILHMDVDFMREIHIY